MRKKDLIRCRSDVMKLAYGDIGCPNRMVCYRPRPVIMIDTVCTVFLNSSQNPWKLANCVRAFFPFLFCFTLDVIFNAPAEWSLRKKALMYKQCEAMTKVHSVTKKLFVIRGIKKTPQKVPHSYH